MTAPEAVISPGKRTEVVAIEERVHHGEIMAAGV